MITQEVISNPLKYWCAPNQATPDYVSAQSIEDFIAYGFMRSWIDPDCYSFADKVTLHDIQEIRERFLRILEDTLQYIYDGTFVAPMYAFDEDEFSQDNRISIATWHKYDPEHEHEPIEDINLYWFLDRIHEDALAMSFNCDVLIGEGNGGTPDVIWLDTEAYQDRERVRKAIAHAREINALPGSLTEAESTTEWWNKLGVK